MPHGHPDYGQSQSAQTISSVSDLGELVDRGKIELLDEMEAKEGEGN